MILINDLGDGPHQENMERIGRYAEKQAWAASRRVDVK
jgi:hypothetical protein